MGILGGMLELCTEVDNLVLGWRTCVCVELHSGHAQERWSGDLHMLHVFGSCGDVLAGGVGAGWVFGSTNLRTR